MAQTKRAGKKSLEAFIKRYNLRLNTQQKDAVRRTSGETLLLAVPGSGKTTVIIARTAYLIKEMDVDPSNILTMTFSRASANDLLERYLEVYGDDGRRPRFSTIHSFALSVIKNCERMLGKPAFEVLPNNQALVSDVYKEMKGQRPSETDLAEILALLTYAKNLALPEEEIAKIECEAIDFKKFFRKYEAVKKKKRVMDFDDLLIYALRLLKKFPPLLERYRKQYRHIHVDEAQDTSKIQFEIIKLLAKGCESLFMVGDEDQSIYGFRGAYPEGLLSFKEDYPGGEVLLMETNFRSTGELVRRADQFIRLNEGRYEKHIKSFREQGLRPVQEYVKDQEEAYRYILEAARRESGELAVLYRNNESVLPLIDLFEREGMPYRVKEHNPLFFSNFIIKDLHAFLRFSKDPEDFDAFQEICFKTSARISRDNLNRLARTKGHVLNAFLSLSLPEWLEADIKNMKDAFDRLQGLGAKEAVDQILYEIGYMDYLEYRMENGLSRTAVMQKINILRSLAGREKNLESFFSRLDTLKEIVKEGGEKEGAGPLFTTIHSSKGLEFDKVIMLDCYEEVLPALEPGEDPDEKRLYLEEVRLFYVGVTRAKSDLVFLSVGSKTRQPRGKEDSRFIKAYLGK